MPSLKSLTDHFKGQFFNEKHQEIIANGSNFMEITPEEVKKNKGRLKNNKAAGPDGTKSEDLKEMDDIFIAEKLNILLKTRDKILTHGVIVPVLKPKKSAIDPSSYRPITLLSPWRKLLSLIVLERITRDLDEDMNRSQHAYCKAKSTGDVVLAHKLMMAGNIEREFNPTLVGIDMSKAFDTV